MSHSSNLGPAVTVDLAHVHSWSELSGAVEPARLLHLVDSSPRFGLALERGSLVDSSEQQELCALLRSPGRLVVSSARTSTTWQGTVVMLSSDVRIVTPETVLATVSPAGPLEALAGVSDRWAQALGPGALAVLLDDRGVSSGRASVRGLIDHVVPDDGFDAFISELLDSMSRRPSSPLAEAKALLAGAGSGAPSAARSRTRHESDAISRSTLDP